MGIDDLWSAVLTDAAFRLPAVRLLEARAAGLERRQRDFDGGGKTGGPGDRMIVIGGSEATASRAVY